MYIHRCCTVFVINLFTNQIASSVVGSIDSGEGGDYEAAALSDSVPPATLTKVAGFSFYLTETDVGWWGGGGFSFVELQYLPTQTLWS